jgi:amino acid permease
VLWVLGAVFTWTGLVVLDCCKRVDAARAAAAAAASASAAAATTAAAAAAAAPPRPAEPAGYEDVAEAAFGGLGRKLVGLVMYAELLGICTVYLVLEVGRHASIGGGGHGGGERARGGQQG